MQTGKNGFKNDFLKKFGDNRSMDYKKIHIRMFGLLLASIGHVSAAAAESVDWSLGVQPELELTSRLGERLDLRFGVSGDANRNENRLRNAESAGLLDQPVVLTALVDWSFSDNGFRLTGGAMYGDQVLNGAEFSFANSETYATRTYLGLGWDNHLDSSNRLGISLDLGLSFEALEGDSEAAGRTFSGPSDSLFGQSLDTLRYEPSFSASLEYRF